MLLPNPSTCTFTLSSRTTSHPAHASSHSLHVYLFTLCTCILNYLCTLCTCIFRLSARVSLHSLPVYLYTLCTRNFTLSARVQNIYTLYTCTFTLSSRASSHSMHATVLYTLCPCIITLSTCVPAPNTFLSPLHCLD